MASKRRASVALSTFARSARMPLGSVMQRLCPSDSTRYDARESLTPTARSALPASTSSSLPAVVSRVESELARRASRWFIMPSISPIVGATDSAAPVGVEQRLSATMSQMLVSGSCPMPVTTGTGLAATARASASSLKHMRSSNEPPPRTRRMASGRYDAAIRRARMMVAGAPAPWTLQPTTSSSTRGFLLASVRFTSSMTLPESDVTTATREQNRGTGRLRASSMRPSRWSLRARAATCARSSPSPAGSADSAMNESLPHGS